MHVKHMLGGHLRRKGDNVRKVLVAFVILLSNVIPMFGDEIELIPNELVVNMISKNVYIATHYFPWESNSLIITTNENNVILIDTPYTNEATEILYNMVTKDKPNSTIKAIVTGYHIDNIGGIEYLKSQNIEVMGSKLTNQLIESNGIKSIRTLLKWLNRATQKKYMNYYSSAKMVKTTNEIDITSLYTYQLDNVKLELFYPGESHAKDNLTMFIENENVLFGSCIIKSIESKNLGFTIDANMKNWPIAVKQIKERYKNVSVVIPHHGKWGGKELFDHTLSLF
jgi:metallo-beta-lactamase class B